MDLLTLADVVLHPRDDLALATILKSPLFGLSEEELLSLASKREGSCALRSAASGPTRRTSWMQSRNWRGAARRFAFYAELLGAGGGRRAFLSRIGHEANDALDEFLNLALDYEFAGDAIAAGLCRLAAYRFRRGETRYGNGAR